MGKGIFIGACIFVSGLIIAILSGANSPYYGIIFSILYLSAVIGTSAYVIYEQLKKR